MRAAVLLAKEQLTVRDEAPPQVGPENVLIEVRASGVCGTDVHMYHGSEGSTALRLPLIMGHEFSGVALVVGEGVAELRAGDKVTVNPNIMCGRCRFCRSGRAAFCENHVAVGVSRPGGFAQRVSVPRQAVHRFEQADFDEAAMIEPLSCCLNVFEEMPYKVGDAYLIVGGGPIGMMMLQLARMAGGRFVAVAELVPEKRQKCLDLGADAAFDSRTDKAADVAAAFGVKQFDAIVDCVGLTATQEYSLACAGRGTRVMFFGLGGSQDILKVQPYRLFYNQIPIYSSYINPYTFERAVEIVESGKVNMKSIVSACIGLDDLEAVLRDPARRSEGKVLVRP